MSVLSDSEGLPSVSGEEFLFRSLEVLEKGSKETAEFGECIIVRETDQVEYTYDNTFINTCDTSGLELKAMTAQRNYYGPKPLFNFVTISGQKYCRYGGVRVKTDAPATCAKLSMLAEIPTADRGEISVRGCSGVSQCVELILDQAGDDSGAIMKFKARPGIMLSQARVTGSGIDTKGYVSHNGTKIMTANGAKNIPAIVSNPQITHEIGVFGGSVKVDKREPATGYADADTSYIQTSSPPLSRYNYIKFNGVTVTDRYECIYSRGPLFDSGVYSVGGSDGGSGVFWSRYYVYRTCEVTDYPDGKVVLRLNFTPTDLFSPWGFNATQYNELLSLASDSACTLRYTVDATVKDADGCVNAWNGSKGKPGKLCGSDIPLSPFTMLPDRAATKITITPSCFNDPGGEAFVETNNCSILESDASCTFIGRTCSLTLAGGECAAYENRYQCGTIESYTGPVVKELNICKSSVSCMGDDCILNTGTSGAVDLADTAAKLAAADMLMSDMQCADDLNTAVDRDKAMLSCELFAGERETCSKRTLGLSNCCTTPSGVSVSDYLQLAFSISRLSRAIEGTSMSNPLTSSWVSMEDITRNSFSELTRPLTETWESIVGNSNAAKDVGSALSMETVKQEMMKKAASWTAEIFGEQAANSIFQAGGSPAFVGGKLQTGTLGLTQTAATAMSAVMLAYTVYTLINVLSAILFACSEDEQELMVRRALKSTHEVGEYCSREIFGHCVSKRTTFCMFNSPLSRIMNEQARKQLGIEWGSPTNTNCQGITVAQFQKLDMNKVDLSEWTGMMMSSGMIDFDAVTDIDKLTGTDSTYGKALEDIYTREDAITRNTNRYQSVDTDQLREDAASDFGRGIVK